MNQVEVFAPGRADLAGGTLDLWPLWCLHPGSLTVNVSLACGVRLRLGKTSRAWAVHLCQGRERLVEPGQQGQDLTASVVGHFFPEGGVRVEVLEQLPIGSGVGGSSVYAVALAKACLQLAGRGFRRRQLVSVLKDLEAQVLEAPTGVQDYYPALLPGLLAIHLQPGGERVERLPVPRGWVARHLVVVYTGITHHSGMVNWQVLRARVDGDESVRRHLDQIALAARACRHALLARDAEGVARAIAREWQARRELAPAVAPPELAKVVDAGLAAGAWAAKACGAGGGGSVLFWCPPEKRGWVLEAALALCPQGFSLPVAKGTRSRAERSPAGSGLGA